MPNNWEALLERWSAAGLLDPGAAERIREFEGRDARSQGLRWPAWVALAFGTILLCAGVLLFVSAHWDELAPGARMALVLLMVAVFHVAGAALTERFSAMAVALHTVGTIMLGAAIALAGQIYQISEHWPSAILMWACGAALAWALLRHWTQGLLTAILFPWWLAGEWVARNPDAHVLPVSAGVCGLSFAYLTARRTAADSPFRKGLGWLGCIALLPSAAMLAAEHWSRSAPFTSGAVGWIVALLAPLAVAALLRGREAIWNATALAWIAVLAAINQGGLDTVLIYVWCAVGAANLVVWGLRDARSERVNLGIAGFAITVLAFYFSSVMDKLGRSMSLMGLGLLFLGGGWALERMRRVLIARIREAV
ncbi:MAG TPA: DUF2157 domain-containing protein [Candidatus Sulfopaludibacter sp.]|jgi:uncharacterized membrane protein|nr:DUF2157 domain-containing protein [Candidatus Sulfopaludibacter sp.]